MKLKTKLPAYIKGELLSDYSCELSKKHNKVVITIIPSKGTGGCWSYYLEDILGLDSLSLDYGQQWEVRGIHEMLVEIVNLVPCGA